MDLIEIDATGHRCPVPTLKLQKALAQQPAGAAVRLIADDPMAKVDVPHFCEQNGYLLVSAHPVDETSMVFTVMKSA